MYKSYSEYLDSVCKEENFFFIQIGAHEGGTVKPEREKWSPHLVDPLYTYIKNCKWKGILVEPHEDSYKILKDFYKKEEDNLIFENIAISENGGEVILYISETAELSSIAKYNHEPLRKVVATKTIDSLSINELCENYAVKDYNLLQIDTEGYDAKIVSTIDFSVATPGAICFEHKHCPKEDLNNSHENLVNNNYKLVYEDEFDFLYKRFI